jgi:hypothetical protein
VDVDVGGVEVGDGVGVSCAPRRGGVVVAPPVPVLGAAGDDDVDDDGNDGADDDGDGDGDGDGGDDDGVAPPAPAGRGRGGTPSGSFSGVSAPTRNWNIMSWSSWLVLWQWIM